MRHLAGGKARLKAPPASPSPAEPRAIDLNPAATPVKPGGLMTQH